MIESGPAHAEQRGTRRFIPAAVQVCLQDRYGRSRRTRQRAPEPQVSISPVFLFSSLRFLKQTSQLSRRFSDRARPAGSTTSPVQALSDADSETRAHTSTKIRQRSLESAAVAVILAVTTAEIGGDGWESNPPRTNQQRPANGFEDPCGRVEYRTGPNGPLTQRSINRLGVRRIVFLRTLGHVTHGSRQQSR